MRVIMAPIDMVARFDMYGKPMPARFKYGNHVIDIEQVLDISEEKLAGNRMKIFSRQSEIDGEIKRYDLKFELQTFICTEERQTRI